MYFHFFDVFFLVVISNITNNFFTTFTFAKKNEQIFTVILLTDVFLYGFIPLFSFILYFIID